MHNVTFIPISFLRLFEISSHHLFPHIVILQLQKNDVYRGFFICEQIHLKV